MDSMSSAEIRAQLQPTLPTFGEIVPGAGGRLGAIMRGALINGVRAGDYALIVPDDASGKLGRREWGAYGKEIKGADSLTDGMANTAAMAKAGSELGLAMRALRIDGFDDWYLPARGEMWALRANVPELFVQEWHWTSTQDSAHGAFVQGFQDGYSSWSLKDNEYQARAVRRIPLVHLAA